MAEVTGFIGFGQDRHDGCDRRAIMGAAGLILRLDGLLTVFKIAYIPCLTGGPFDVGHDHKGDDIVVDDGATSLGFVGFDSQLLVYIHEPVEKVKA